MQELSIAERERMGRVIASKLADQRVKAQSEDDLRKAIGAALGAKPEFARLSPLHIWQSW